jgi:hypothetical protein
VEGKIRGRMERDAGRLVGEHQTKDNVEDIKQKTSLRILSKK